MKYFLLTLTIMFASFMLSAQDSALNLTTDTRSVYAYDFNHHYGDSDPLEGFNRAMYPVNRFSMHYIAMPIGTLWGSIMPMWGQHRFINMLNNIEFPIRMFNNFFQNKWKDGGQVFVRFLTNTTLGIAGMFDVASSWFELEEKDEDFGQSMASWGTPRGAQLHLPFYGPTTVRDGTGALVDCAFNPLTYIPIPGIYAVLAVNRVNGYYREFDGLDRSSYDPYEVAKRLNAHLRNVKERDQDRASVMAQMMMESYFRSNGIDPSKMVMPIETDTVLTHFFPQTAFIDATKYSMSAMNDEDSSIWSDLSLWNGEFYYSGQRREVPVFKNRPDLKYKVFYQDDKTAPLCIILPGTGTSFMSVEMTAQAKEFYDEGYTVAILPNSFSAIFYESASSSKLPGYLPNDVLDIQRAIHAVIQDLTLNKKCQFSQKILVGTSLGAMQTLAIAAHEDNPYNLKFDQYIAFSPPVELKFALESVDSANKSFYAFSDSERFDVLSSVLAKYLVAKPMAKAFSQMVLVMRQDSRLAPYLPKENDPSIVVSALSDTEAQMLVAYNFSFIFQDLLACATFERYFEDSQFDLNKSKTQLYRDFTKVNFNVYTQKLLPKAIAQAGLSLSTQDLIDANNLMLLEEKLKNRSDIVVFHAANDFIASDAHRKWLELIFPATIIYPVGGHLGYFYHPVHIKNIHKHVLPVKKK